jgi:HSP20 family protein
MSTSSNPFEELERLFDRMSRQFDDRGRLLEGDGPFGRLTAGLETMPVDLVDRPEEFVATVDLPGFEREDIEIQVTDNQLHITADHEEIIDDEKEDRYIHHERHRSSTRRSIRLPEEVDRDGVEARMKNGVLIVTLPKRELEEGRKIEIETA